LAQFPQMPASVIAERVGWTFSASVLRALGGGAAAVVCAGGSGRPDDIKAGEIVQGDLWFPGRVVPVAKNVLEP
jgi:hypothetical protein